MGFHRTRRARRILAKAEKKWAKEVAQCLAEGVQAEDPGSEGGTGCEGGGSGGGVGYGGQSAGGGGKGVRGCGVGGGGGVAISGE